MRGPHQIATSFFTQCVVLVLLALALALANMAFLIGRCLLG